MLKILFWILFLIACALCITGLSGLADDRGSWIAASQFGAGFIILCVAGAISLLIRRQNA